MINDLSDRLENFAVEIIKVVLKFRGNFVIRHIVGQLLSSSTSAGANYEEACGAESRSDFIQLIFPLLKEYIPD
jgi:four helix bundle protein